jgi:hypothetical protein
MKRGPNEMLKRITIFLLTGVLVIGGAYVAKSLTPHHNAVVVPDADGVEAFSPTVWDQPLGSDGSQVQSANDANLPYSVEVPGNFGNPVRILATAKSRSAPISREIAWVFQDPRFGRILLVQQVVSETQAQLEEPATNAPGCQPSPAPDGEITECHFSGFSVRTLEDGTRALVTLGDGISTIRWLKPLRTSDSSAANGVPSAALGVEIFAHSDAVTPDDLVSLANRV